MDDTPSAVLDPAAGQQEDDGLGNTVDNGAPPTPPADLGPEPEAEEAAEQTQLFLHGPRERGMKVGGRKPDSSTLKFKGSKVDLEGQYDRGDRIVTVDIWQVTGDNDQDTIETATGAVKGTTKTQNATLCGTSTLGDYLALKLEADAPELYRQLVPLLDLEQD